MNTNDVRRRWTDLLQRLCRTQTTRNYVGLLHSDCNHCSKSRNQTWSSTSHIHSSSAPVTQDHHAALPRSPLVCLHPAPPAASRRPFDVGFPKTALTFMNLHSAVCGKVGSRRCLVIGHYIQCQDHGAYYSKISECVRCVQTAQRESRQEGKDPSQKDNEKPTSREKKKAKKCKSSKPKKLDTFKQLRKGKNTLRKSASPATSQVENAAE